MWLPTQKLVHVSVGMLLCYPFETVIRSSKRNLRRAARPAEWHCRRTLSARRAGCSNGGRRSMATVSECRSPEQINCQSMLLTISTVHKPATDLGYLLHKNPTRVQTEDLSFGKAHVFYPEASDHLCVAALLLEVDPIALVRNNRGPAGEGGQLQQYVNDRPYAANSFLSVAIGRMFASALGGRSK